MVIQMATGDPPWGARQATNSFQLIYKVHLDKQTTAGNLVIQLVAWWIQLVAWWIQLLKSLRTHCRV